MSFVKLSQEKIKRYWHSHHGIQTSTRTKHLTQNKGHCPALLSFLMHRQLCTPRRYKLFLPIVVYKNIHLEKDE